MNIFRTRTRRGAAILFSGVLVLGGLALTSEATAVKNVDDNPTCEYLGFTYGEKWEDPSGTYSVDRDGMTANFTVGTYDDVAEQEPNEDNAITAYSVSTAGDYAIVVKAADGATVYDPGAAVPLHAPANASGKWPTISHFDLCWNKPAPEPELGQLNVKKVVAGTDTPDDFTFEICVTPVGGGTKLCKEVEGDGTLTFENLPVGDYVVTETDPGPRFSVEGSGVTVTVKDEDITLATITNTWIPPSEEFGQIEVTKVVTGEAAPTDGRYEICLTGPDPSTTKECKTIVGEGTVTFDDLVPGTYTVTETDPGPRFSVEGSGVTVTVEPEDITRATVTNTWIPPSEQFGRVEVTKVVTGEDAPTDGRYEICLTGPDPSTTKECKTIVGEGTVTFDDLVPGTYTVTETDPGPEYTGPEYTATIDPATVKVAIGEVAKATVTNEYTEEESLPPTTPVTPVTPVTPAAPATPAAPVEVSAQTALPTTGSEGGLAAIAAILVTTGLGLTMLSKRRGTQQA